MAEPSDETYWNLADFAHREIIEGRAKGNRRSLWLRARLQTFLFKLGNFAQIHSASVLMIGLVILIGCTLGLYKAKLETNPENLWMEVGGRLEKEITHSKEVGSDFLTSYEMIIQTPNRQKTDVLTLPALQKHVEFVRKAMEVEVDVFEQTWTVRDLCLKPSLPEFNDEHGSIIKKSMTEFLPCVVITPLDCFWDGAKIHTHNTTLFSTTISWASSSPLDLIDVLRDNRITALDLDKLKSMLNETGVSYGYLKRPCLNPQQDGCPRSAPNKASKQTPDIGKVLTGGCKGFAEKFMQWPEELIVGGVQRNQNGIITSAKALQTIISLLNEQDLHDYWRDTNGYLKAKVNHLDWSPEKAKIILQTWERKFVEVVNGLSSKSSQQNVRAFSTTSFNDLLNNFSAANSGLIAGGYVLMLVYACFTMIRWNSMVQSQGCMGILGVLLVSLSVAAGLGVCSFFNISFNAASTQVLPFLALGLGVDDMFLLSHTYRDLNSRNLRSKENAGYCLATTGVSIMLTSFTNAMAFFMAAIIPIPALRTLCIKAGVIVIFNFLAVVIIYPAMIAMDVKRRQNQRYDIFCCVHSDSHTKVTKIRENTISYDNSMVTVNQTDDDSLQQISTASANVSMGLSSGDLFVLPAVTLKTSANCNFNKSLCNGVLGGDVMAFPGMSNIVVSVSSGNNVEGGISQTANANVRANISNNMKGSALNINASCSTGSNSSHSSGKSDRSEQKSKRGARNTSSRVNRDCRVGSASMANLSATKDGKSKANSNLWNNDIDENKRNENNSRGGKKGSRAQSSVNINSQNNGSSHGNLYISANSVAHTNQGEPSCSSNAEVILRPDQAHSSRGQNNPWQSSPSQNVAQTKCAKISLRYLTKTFYAPFLQKLPVKIMVLFLCVIIFSMALFGCFQVKDGLDITDVVPKGSKVSDFLETRYKYFSFYDIVIVTTDFNYPNGQEKLYELHKSFARVDNIVMSEDNALPKFWLMYLRDWLKGLQKAFDSDWERNAITYSGPFPNASANGKLAYKLLLQTVDPDNPNKEQQVKTVKLVNEQGIIHWRGFYSFLRAWYNLDPMGYELSQAQIKPVPDFWENDEDRNTIRPAESIKYARIPLVVNNLRDTDDYVKTIKQVREICDRFSDDGLPNYPRGVPFTFWEQYIWLRRKLLVTISIVLVVSFLVISAVLVNIWAGFIVTVVLAMTTIELYGFLGLAGIKLSVIPAVTLILSIGVGVEFTVHLCMVFVTSIGDRNQRLQQSLETVLCPVVDGAISTMLGIIMLAGSEFDFVVKYFFYVLTALIVIGFMNGVLFLPVFLSLAGPNPEVIPLQRLPTAASKRSWLGLMPLDRTACSSVSNLTFDAQQAGQRESTTEAEDVHLQIMPALANWPSEPKVKRWKKNVTPRSYYGKNNNDYTTEYPKQAFSASVDRPQPGQSLRSAPSFAKLTATATVTVELQQRDSQVATSSAGAMVTRSSCPETDLELVDCEEEFV